MVAPGPDVVVAAGDTVVALDVLLFEPDDVVPGDAVLVAAASVVVVLFSPVPRRRRPDVVVPGATVVVAAAVAVVVLVSAAPDVVVSGDAVVVS